MKTKIVLFSIFICSLVHAQFGVSVGPSVLSTFGIGKPFYGINLGVEIPSDDESSLYLRASFYKKQFDANSIKTIQLTNIDPTDFSIQFATTQGSFNYSTFEGGMRRYIGGGYDNAFSLYGGMNLIGVLSQARNSLVEGSTYDKTKYILPSTSGAIVSVGVGVNGGVKYTFPGRGTVFTDISMDYFIRSVGTTPTVQSSLYSPIILTFNVGFRREFY